METAVAFVCDAPAHRSGEGGGPDKLTVHDGRWAFCAYDSKADGHEWKPSSGLSLSMLRHPPGVRELSKGRDGSP